MSASSQQRKVETLTKHLDTLLLISGVRGDTDRLEALLAETEADVVLVVGDLGQAWSKADTYRAIFKTLGGSKRPTFWVPGPVDAPLSEYLREAYNMELVFPSLRCVHGTLALGPSNVLFAGMGGDIVDDPDAVRGEEAYLTYGGWEVEYRLKAIRDFDEHERILLFTTQPAHKGMHADGSEVLAELIKTYRPRLVVVAGDEPEQRQLGKTPVICPGRLDRGSYALVDFRTLTVEHVLTNEQPA
jgi:Icc-related predicted phosphoesterase